MLGRTRGGEPDWSSPYKYWFALAMEVGRQISYTPMEKEGKTNCGHNPFRKNYGLYDQHVHHTEA